MEVQQEKVRAFFDALAPGWDAQREMDGAVIGGILADADICPGVTVLDVACGTGVLFPFYLERGAAHITGVDISPEMIRLAGDKCRDSRVTLLAGDAEQLPLGQFDRIVVFNAFPHFPNPQRLVAALSGHLTGGGRLTIAHDRSRFSINGHHEQTASEVSLGLPPASAVAALCTGAGLTVDRIADDERHYVVSAVRTEKKKETTT